MSTITNTLTSASQASAAAAYPMERPADNTYYGYLERLGSILERNHLEWQDTLSCQLQTEGTLLIKYALNQTSKPSDKALKAAFERFKNTLIHPMGTALLKDPWLMGDLVMEKCVLDRYRQCFSVFSQESIEAKVHLFAKEVLDWIHSIHYLVDQGKTSPLILSAAASAAAPTTYASSTATVQQLGIKIITRSSPTPTPDPIMSLAKLNTSLPLDEETAERELEQFNRLFAKVLDLRVKESEIRHLSLKNEILEQELEASDHRRYTELVRLEETCARHLQNVKNTLNQIKDDYNDSLTAKDIILSDCKVVQESLRTNILQLGTEMRSLKDTLRNLTYQLQSLRAYANHLQNEINNQDGDCAIC